MKIVVPLANIDHYENLVKAGADEFYCGYVPYEWLNSFSITLPLNRREWLLSGNNIHSVDSIIILKENVQKYGVPVKFTFNSRYYVPEQYPLILEIMNRLIEHGFKTFIISDFALIEYLKHSNIICDIHVSGLGSIRNSECVKFIKQYSGIKRIILPRKTSISDIKKIIMLNSEYEYEVFLLNERCLCSEEYCNGLLCDRLLSPCTIPFKLAWTENDRMKNLKNVHAKIGMLTKGFNQENIKKDDNRIGVRGCGLCEISELMAAGVTHVKVVGRMLDVDKIAEDIMLVKRLISLVDIENYKEYMKKELFDNKCPEACYFLESGR